MTAIMLVEDNRVTRKFVRFTLEREGFDVVEAADGETALRLFDAGRIALVLQDLALPDMDGFQLVQRLRSLSGGGDVPILAFSGLISEVGEARLSAVGFDDVISKPVEPSRLVQIVRTHLLPTQPEEGDRFGTGRFLLVVDDDAVQRKLVATHFRRLGFDVRTAADGAEALDEMKDRRPHIVVSDVLMPRLDGFGLCLAARQDPALASIPLVLTTNSYVEPTDRQLARKSGAADLVFRTPELADLIKVVRSTLERPFINPEGVVTAAELDAERLGRVVRQLEKQVALNAGSIRRSAQLSAQLAVLNAVAEALSTQEDTELALRQALASCFDAGGISFGALYLLEGKSLGVVSIGLVPEDKERDLLNFFGARALLDRAIASRQEQVLSASDVLTSEEVRFFAQAPGDRAFLIPLQHRDAFFGVLLMLSRDGGVGDTERLLFARTVATVISLALAVTQAFAHQQASERIATERAQVLRSILDAIGDAVVVFDNEGEISQWNPAAERIIGKAPERGGAASWARACAFFAPDQVTPIDTHDLPVSRAMRGEHVEGTEIFVRSHGEAEGTWLSVTARPWLDAQQQIRGAVSVLRDVSKDKATQAHLMVSDRMASIGMLAAGVAHEINNPLAAVLGNLELAHRDIRHSGEAINMGELAEMIEDARTAADRVRQIVKDLKIFARQEEARVAALDVNRVVESTLRMAWNEVRHRARLVKELGLLPPVEGVESRLGQVLLNLVVNAAQAIPEGQAERNTIRVVTRLDSSGRVAIDVSDTGSGMTPDTVRKLFTPFFTTKPAGVGTGLGLAICQRIVGDHGGEIQVDSQLGRGTRFTVLLPSSTLAIQSVDTDVSEAGAPRRGTVLVLDDEPMIGAVVRRSLSGEHDVEIASLATDALERIRRGKRYDVILCDLMMPQVSGVEFHRELRRIDPQLADRVIFLTGGAFTAAARSFLDDVTNPRIEKPFDVQQVRALVNDRIRAGR